jgi:hypothetical protein
MFIPIVFFFLGWVVCATIIYHNFRLRYYIRNNFSEKYAFFERNFNVFRPKKILMKFDFVDSLINESVQIISVRLKYLFWLLIATFFSLAILITVAALTKTT